MQNTRDLFFFLFKRLEVQVPFVYFDCAHLSELIHIVLMLPVTITITIAFAFAFALARSLFDFSFPLKKFRETNEKKRKEKSTIR